MTDSDLSAELDRLDKAANPGPWINVALEVVGPDAVSVADAVTDHGGGGLADAELIVWLRNHTDEIKAALQDAPRLRAMEQGWGEEHCLCGCKFEAPTLEAIERAKDAEAETDRLRATVQRVETELQDWRAHGTSNNDIYDVIQSIEDLMRSDS